MGKNIDNTYNINVHIINNIDAVTRTVYYKYHHPKEVFIANGILNREINRAAGKKIGTLSYYSSNTSLNNIPASENAGGGLIGIDVGTSTATGKGAGYESNYFNPKYVKRFWKKKKKKKKKKKLYLYIISIFIYIYNI